MQRRTAIQSLAATAALFHIVPRHVLGGPGQVPPSEKIHLAIIGAGGRGRQVLRGMMNESDTRVIAVADPARSFSLANFYYKDVGGREPTREMVERHYQANEPSYRCAVYEDFREMLSAEPDLDAIICGTPDHLHAHVSAHCLAAGKHVYCEKPLTHNIGEARVMAEWAKQSGLATQMGNQGHSTEGMRQTREWLEAGAIGTVREVQAWVGGHRWNPSAVGIPASSDVPEGLNWDLWLGPRTERPFAPEYFPVAWRDFWAFGNSNIGDFGCHDLDAACWTLGLRHPTRVDFQPAGICNEDIGPHGCIGYYEFPATADRGPIRVTWHDGGIKPPTPPGWPEGQPLPSRGILFLGDDGVLFCGGAGGAPKLIPDSRMATFQPPQASIRRVASHQRDWLDACRGGEAAGSNFEYGANLTELALLGALSLRLRKAIRWNGEAATAEGLPEADAIIRETYRDGWSVPTPS